jgi:hypothetical protein
MTPELFKAILAMDSYNRGPGAGINLTEAGASDTQIGNATLGLNSDDPSANMQTTAPAAGFFAQAYNWNGTTVISYRGTDNPTFLASPNGPSDIVNGWLSDVGVPTSMFRQAAPIGFAKEAARRLVG